MPITNLLFFDSIIFEVCGVVDVTVSGFDVLPGFSVVLSSFSTTHSVFGSLILFRPKKIQGCRCRCK